MTLKEQIKSIVVNGQYTRKSPDFVAKAILFHMECQLKFKLNENGWLDDDQETVEEICLDDDMNVVYGKFLSGCGLKMSEITQ